MKSMDGKKVYAIKFADEQNYTSIACRCEIRNIPKREKTRGFRGLCYLTPPDRGHMIAGTVTEETSDGFKFNSTGYAPGEWTFTEITIDNLEQFAGLIMADPRLDAVSTTNELQAYFNR
jgi:hypothetical protein